jgi:hypothetical protein
MEETITIKTEIIQTDDCKNTQAYGNEAWIVSNGVAGERREQGGSQGRESG